MLMSKIDEKATEASKAAFHKYMSETDGEYESEAEAEATMAASSAAGDEATKMARTALGDDADVFGFFDAETLTFKASEVTVRGVTVLQAD